MPPTIASRYDITRTLGKGSFGHTFLARDLQRGCEVAIKLLDARNAMDLKPYELFEREASVLRSLRHHGIPEVFDSFRDVWEGVDAPFLVMEYVEGTSLAQLIESKQHLEPGELTHILLELLSILEYLHACVPPVLHRDIKPANIIVRPNGFPAVVDFGSVRRVFLGPDESGSTVAGTYGYMPYEQYMGQASPSSDLYAVAATMLHVVTGRPPRDFMNAEGRIEVPAELPGDARFRGVIARMLQPSPSERFPSAREVRQALLSPGTAVAPARADAIISGRRVEALSVFSAAPRAITGVVEARWKAVSHPWWRIAGSSEKLNEDGHDITSLALFGFLCVATCGILPAIFIAIARARRRRFRRFFINGTPGVAEITGMRPEKTAFDAKLTRVSYQFVVEGALRRDSDLVLPVVADRWAVGDQIEILYIAARDYDSVIISPN
jgi:hypothetical protein